jgi:hypothetical protein
VESNSGSLGQGSRVERSRDWGYSCIGEGRKRRLAGDLPDNVPVLSRQVETVAERTYLFLFTGGKTLATEAAG